MIKIIRFYDLNHLVLSRLLAPCKHSITEKEDAQEEGICTDQGVLINIGLKGLRIKNVLAEAKTVCKISNHER